MTKNVTLSLDTNIIHQAKILAVQKDVSLSQWLSALIVKTIKKEREYDKAKKRAVELMEKGFRLRGKHLSREEIYER